MSYISTIKTLPTLSALAVRAEAEEVAASTRKRRALLHQAESQV